MPKIAYMEKRFGASSLRTIEQAEQIINEYVAQGYRLTLRQLYYQFVARGLIKNRTQEYKRLGELVSDGRLCGLLDWSAIEDRTRNLESLAHWSDPAAIVDVVAEQFRTDRWAAQPCRVEVWIEKEALAGVFAGVCEELDVPYFSCRGYTSQSEMWAAAMRLRRYQKAGQRPVVLHFGDHDPSGMDMSRDIVDRLNVFGLRAEFSRLALNMEQVEEWSPPPNPAKVTDSRFAGYADTYGLESWELDALEPATLTALVRDAVESHLDPEAWDESEQEIAEGRKLLRAASDRWAEVVELLDVEGSDNGR